MVEAAQGGVLCVWVTAAPLVAFATAACVLFCVNVATLFADEGHEVELVHLKPRLWFCSMSRQRFA